MALENGNNWWSRLLGTSLSTTEGESNLANNGKSSWLNSQEAVDARRLIELGNRTGDTEAVKIGQARLRFLQGRQTPEDENLFSR